MRHGKKFNHLGRKSSHRVALLSNLAISLILHKRINTTLAKAKALRKYVEPLITKSKKSEMHSQRVVFSYLQNKESVKELFEVIANKVSDRPGGYTRILRTGVRLGDGAEMCMMELVDFNTIYTNNKNVLKEQDVKGKEKRTRRSSSKKKEGIDVVDKKDTTSDKKEENK